MATGRKTTSCSSLVVLAVLLLLSSLGGVSVEARKQGKQSLGYYELRRGEFSIVVTNWGATILSVRLPDKNGQCYYLHRFIDSSIGRWQL